MWLDLERNVTTLRMSNVGPTSSHTPALLQPHSSCTPTNVGPLTFTRRRAAGGLTAYERLRHPSGPRYKKYSALFLLHQLAELGPNLHCCLGGDAAAKSLICPRPLVCPAQWADENSHDVVSWVIDLLLYRRVLI